MAVTGTRAVMPQAVITDEMIATMAAKAGLVLRIDHSVNNELASRIAVTKFAGGIGDINPLSDVVQLRGTVTATRIDDDGDHVADVRTEAVNQRGEVVMPGRAVIALPSRDAGPSPAARKARTS